MAKAATEYELVVIAGRSKASRGGMILSESNGSVSPRLTKSGNKDDQDEDGPSKNPI